MKLPLETMIPGLAFPNSTVHRDAVDPGSTAASSADPPQAAAGCDPVRLNVASHQLFEVHENNRLAEKRVQWRLSVALGVERLY